MPTYDWDYKTSFAPEDATQLLYQVRQHAEGAALSLSMAAKCSMARWYAGNGELAEDSASHWIRGLIHPEYCLLHAQYSSATEGSKIGTRETKKLTRDNLLSMSCPAVDS